MKRSKSSRILKILSYVLLITGMIVILYPFYLTIITALKTPQESSQSFFSFPQSFYLGNFVNVLQKANYFVFFRNSAVVTLVSVFLIMVLIPRNSQRRSAAVQIPGNRNGSSWRFSEPECQASGWNGL